MNIIRILLHFIVMRNISTMNAKLEFSSKLHLPYLSLCLFNIQRQIKVQIDDVCFIYFFLNKIKHTKQ